MKAVLQRVARASVTVDGTVSGRIDEGLLVLLCAERDDTDADAAFFARKVASMRIFADADGKMNRSVKDIGGGVLVVSQFTLAADWRKGNRPGFSRAAAPDEGNRLYEYFCDCVTDEGLPVERGVFGAHMAVELLNDGPVTIVMDSKDG